MNSRIALLSLSIVLAVASLALVINAAGATAFNASGEVSGTEANTVIRSNTDNRLLAYHRPNISQADPLTLTEPISIYLPLLVTEGYLDQSVERAALMALYSSTNGDDWYNNTGWGTEASFCEWNGVTCDGDEHVTVLDLGVNKISGTLPVEIGNLLKLTVLRLGGTGQDCNKSFCQSFFAIQDPFPSEIGKLVHLRVLDLTGNKLNFLPPEIGNLVNLQELYLGARWGIVGNQLTSLPPEIGTLVNLQVLDLGGEWCCRNPLSSLPPEIGNLANLQVLDLSYNQLAFLPGEIGHLVNLRGLRVNDNGLEWLPPEIGNLASLQELNLGNNRLWGFIPSYLSNLGDLNYLELWGNPSLTCWETKEARDWALSLSYYGGPTCVLTK